MFAAKTGCTVTPAEGLFITRNPEESLMTTLVNTVYVLVAGGLITFVILKENVPVFWLSDSILKEISVEVNTTELL
jgi:hypothetical protein